MPVYCFKCPQCGHREEVLRQISARNDHLRCPKCPVVKFRSFEAGNSMRRDIGSEGLGSSDLPYHKPVLSDAMGIHPSEIPAFRKKHPDIGVNHEGQIVINSHREHKRVMKRLGFMDRAGYC